MPIPNVNKTIRNFQRFSHIVNVFARHGLGYFINRTHLARYVRSGRRWFRFRKRGDEEEISTLSIAERLRTAFEELGATFVKLGQMLSMRSDILPEEFIAELRKLQTSTKSFPFSEVREVVRAEIGTEIESAFAEFDQEPFAAASIAQVHRARLADGTPVVVKVQRPEVRQQIETDLNILAFIARLIERHIAEARIYDPVGLISDFARSIRQELDFSAEASNTELFYRYFENDDRTRIPRVFWEYTTKRLLVLEEIRGTNISEICSGSDHRFDRRLLATNIVDIFFQQIFVNGLFHADPHSGNILFLEGNRIALIDFGSVGRMTGDVRRDIRNWLLAILNRDVDLIAKIYVKMGIIGEDTDLTLFKLELAEFLDRYLTRPVNKINLGSLLNEIVISSARYRMRIPVVLVRLAKTIMLIESIVRDLDPEVDMLEVGRPYMRKLIVDQMALSEWFKEAHSTFNDIRDMAKSMPFQVNQIVTKLNKGKLKVDFEAIGLDQLIYEIDRSSNRLTIGLIIAALIVGSSIMVWSDAGFKIFGYSVIGIVGYLIAGVLGFGLVISILRSGRL